jgi:hypothetical protein
MDKGAIKEFMYGGLKEILSNRNYYYSSGAGADFSHLTEVGEIVVVDFVNLVARTVLESEEKELNTRAKELVVKGLKGESL